MTKYNRTAMRTLPLIEFLSSFVRCSFGEVVRMLRAPIVVNRNRCSGFSSVHGENCGLFNGKMKIITASVNPFACMK